MIRHERIGEVEVQEVDLSGVNKVIEVAKLAMVAPDDLRKALVESIHLINKPVFIVGEKK